MKMLRVSLIRLFYRVKRIRATTAVVARMRLRMSQNRMWFVRLLELPDFLLRKLDLQCGNGLIEMVHLGRADDRRGNIGLADEPRQRDLGTGHAALFGNVCNIVRHLKIFIAEVEAVPKWIAVGAHGLTASAAFAIPCKEAARQRAPGDQSDALIDAQGNHLAFFFAID